MRLCAIDVGSNTVRLLVADVTGDDTWRIADQDQTITRLGESLARTGALGEAPMARTLAAVSDYVARAHRLGASRIRIVATSAVREASNGRAFAAKVERATGRRVEVVSGEVEARLTLLGVRHGLGRLPGPMLTFDIGGGSTEYVLSDGEAIRSMISLRLGVVPLAERFPFPGVADPERYQELYDEIRRRLGGELPEAIRSARVAHLIGTAGTVTALAALDLGLIRYDPERVQGHVLSRSAIERLRDRLCRLTVDERAMLPCLEPGRADLIIPGTAIVMATLDQIGVDELRVSEYSLREGVLVDAIEVPDGSRPGSAP
ncbi:MAG TPA: Ppx/GppA phosphatase family protein [Methylomirabilota bacterium]|jgi:exopolyphosphatase/guanosine-5'-triphosphate,3'-diphosphate pyrophosphatase